MRCGMIFGGRGAQGRLQNAPPVVYPCFGRLFGRKWRSNGCPWNPLEAENRSKITLLRINWRVGLPKLLSGRRFGKKHEKSMKKWSRNDSKDMKNCLKILWKIDTFLNMRSLVFCEEYKLKMLFYMIRGSKNPWTIHQKSMQNRCSKKVCKKHGKHSNMEPKSMKNQRKTRSTIYVKMLAFRLEPRGTLRPQVDYQNLHDQQTNSLNK